MRRNLLLLIVTVALGAGSTFAQAHRMAGTELAGSTGAARATQLGTATALTGHALGLLRAAVIVVQAATNDREAILARMNQTAESFKAAQADFDFETYQKIVDEKDHQTGRIYFRRSSNGVEAAFDVSGRAPKQVVYKDGKLLVFEKKIDQLTVRTVGANNKSDVEAFLSLGFGARGTELVRDYEVNMGGWETVDGVKTARLDLVPKKEKVRQTYNKIVLWIDPERDVLLQQQFFEPSGDYRLAHYTNLKLSNKLSDDLFRIKTTDKTRTVQVQ